MLSYCTWRDLAAAFVKVKAADEGWAVVEVRQAATGSVYLRLKGPTGRVACVRLSDHRPRRGLGERLLSIRQRATGRLSALVGWLRSIDRGVRTVPPSD